MIVDANAWCGHWGTLPVKGGAGDVRAALKALGVGRLLLSPLGAAWCHNPHLANAEVYAAARRWPDVDPVPVIDPTLPTWRAEVERAAERARCVRLLPAYSGYRLAQAGVLFAALQERGLGVAVQVRLEDPRRQHPLAQVRDVPAGEVAEVARAFPKLKVVLAGATWSAIRDLGQALLELPHFYADTSQADGMDSVMLFAEMGLKDKLLFGTHAPLFTPLAGLARVLADVDDGAAAAILGGNAQRIFFEVEK